MSRFIRTLFARALTGGVCLLPLGAPADAHAQPRAVEAAAPVANPMTPNELHKHLARGAGWIRIIDGTGVRHGTGWILDLDKKLMVTNHHVVDGADEVVVTFPMWKDGKLVTSEAAYLTAPKVKATVIDRDANRDLAVIRVESIPDGMHALKLAAAEPDAGDEVRLIGGYTNGGDGVVWGAVSGVVRACGPQDLDTNKRRRAVPVREVLSDARTNGGNSGAPVVNAAGEVVAVHFAFKPWATGGVRHVSIVELQAYLKVALPMVEPKTAEQFLTRAKRRFDAGRLDAAATDASAAAVTASNGAPLYLGNLAEALRLAGKHDAAVKGFTKAIDAWKNLEADGVKVAPVKIADDYAARGKSRTALKQYKDAADDLSKALDLTDRKVAWHFAERAAALDGLGETSAATADRKGAGLHVRGAGAAEGRRRVRGHLDRVVHGERGAGDRSVHLQRGRHLRRHGHPPRAERGGADRGRGHLGRDQDHADAQRQEARLVRPADRGER